MALKRCLDCFRWALPGKSRCAIHQPRTTTQRGYGWVHQQARAQALATYHPTDPCPRCGLPLGPDPDVLDLGHTEDKQGYLGLMHRLCNRDTARRR
jgi:hypothetical protein